MERTRKIDSNGEGSRKSLSPGKDDSLTDFKSPRLEQLARNNINIVNDKKGKKSSSKSKILGKKKEAVAQQPSIESSFFKAAINGKRSGHTCPLCMKYFADTSAGTCHTKSCAARNRVSTKKLLAAVALQERQANERVAIGLPAGPIVRPKDNNTPRRHREAAGTGDPDLQLALALSKSLEENRLEEELEEALLLAGENRPDERIGFSSNSERIKTLKNFGFLTNKPVEVSEGPIRTRKKKHVGRTILQTRSQEARDRLLTERIAEILVGNEAITQVFQRKTTAEVEPVKKQRVTLRSCLLKEIHRNTKLLWESAQLSATVADFYVEDLGPFIVPTLLQKRENPKRSNEDEDEDTSGRDSKKYGDPAIISDECSLEDGDRIMKKMSESTEKYEHGNEGANNLSARPNNIHVMEKYHRNTLPMDWANTLNVSFMSDVVVLLENSYVWAHKLVFHVRCSNILLDCETNSDTMFSRVKEKISWLDVDLSTGLAFLEFVYSGLIEKNVRVFSDNRVASGVRRLARKYRLKSLFAYMRSKEAEYEKCKKAIERVEARRSGLYSPIVIDVDETPSAAETVKENFGASWESNDEESKDRESSPTSSNRNTMSVISTASVHDPVSPDLFDETMEEVTAIGSAKNSEQFERNTDLSDNENSNLELLACLIAQDDLSIFTGPSGESAASTIVHDNITKASRSVDEIIRYSNLSQGHYPGTPKSRGKSTHAAVAKIKDVSGFSVKQKSNLSLFIEKVKKINVKGALDSCTEEDSPMEPPGQKRYRNPFIVDNYISEKSIVESSNKEGREWREPERRRCDEKRGPSVIEEQFKLASAANKSSDESISADDTFLAADEDTSVYSKYRKTHKLKNSIGKYRDTLKNLEKEDDEKNDIHLTSLNEKSIDLTRESDSASDADITPIGRTLEKNWPSSKERETVGNASDSDSIRSASMAPKCRYVNSSVSSNSEEPEDAVIRENTGSAASSSKGKIYEGKEYTRISENQSKEAKHLDNSLTRESPWCKKKKTKEEKKKCASSVDYSCKNEEDVYFIDTAPESDESSRNSPRYSDHNLFERDNEILGQSWKSKILNSSPSASAFPGVILSSERKRKREEIGKSRNESFNGDFVMDEEGGRCSAEYRGELDAFEIDEIKMFAERLKKSCVSQRRSFTPWSKRSIDYSEKSRDTLSCSVNDLKTTSLSNSLEYPDVDVDYLFAQSLSDTDTPVRCRSSDAPGKSLSLSCKRRSNGDGTNTRESFIDDLEKSKTDESSESPKSPRHSMGYDYEPVFEPDDRVSTRSVDTLRLSDVDRTLIRSLPNSSASPKVSSSPIVISSSPEFDLDAERNVSIDEGDCGKDTVFATDRSGSPLFSNGSFENFAEAYLPSCAVRSTRTPEPGTSQKYSSSVCGDSSRSVKSLSVRWNSMPASRSNGRTARYSETSITPKKSSRLVISRDVTPPVNYNTMDTPRLKKELQKYGIKPLKGNRARQLLTHIYNELHPVVPASTLKQNADDRIPLTDEDREPSAKKIGLSRYRIFEDSNSDRETSLSQESAASAASIIPEEMDFLNGNASPDDSDDSTNNRSIKKAFNALIEEDKEIHNKILNYEPLQLELLNLMLKARGFNCKSKDLMDFLDEECITFQIQVQRKRSKKIGRKRTAPSGKKEGNLEKS